ncbi:UNVERIFIED_CONTAM: hypothetical protein Sradi_5305500 [Sesamum radiatum]|uniref:Reverse transcriptase domain-containing protein n=1 Tax=Sesamum radiatum TaxID=300843 RepID=A0AAW2LQ28_SESRA
MMQRFDKCMIHQIPREENRRADALSNFEAMVSWVKERKVLVMVRETPTIEEMVISMVESEESWKASFIQYLKNGILPNDPIVGKMVQFKANIFVLIGDELFKRIPKGILLKCLDNERAEYVMKEIHGGSCGNHSGGTLLAQKITRQGYFWPTMVTDALEFYKNVKVFRSSRTSYTPQRSLWRG